MLSKRYIAALLLGLGLLGVLIFGIIHLGNVLERRAAEKYQHILAAVDAEYQQQLQATLQLEQIAAELDIPWPLEAPMMPAGEVAELLELRIQKLLQEQLPFAAIHAEHRREAEKLYGLYQVGDTVTVRVFDRNRQMYVPYTGTLVGYNDERVRIGSRWLYYKDIQENEHVHFQASVSQRLIAQHLENAHRQYQQQVERFRQQQHQQIGVPLYRVSGYHYEPQSRVSISFAAMLRSAVEQRRQQRLQQITNKHFEAAGYWFDGETWQKRSVTDKLQQWLIRQGILSDKTRGESRP